MDSVSIPLSSYQQARFAAIDAEMTRHDAELTRLRALKSEAATALLGVVKPDVADFPDWQVAFSADAIVCTPPAAPAEPSA